MVWWSVVLAALAFVAHVATVAVVGLSTLPFKRHRSSSSVKQQSSSSGIVRRVLLELRASYAPVFLWMVIVAYAGEKSALPLFFTLCYSLYRSIGT